MDDQLLFESFGLYKPTYSFVKSEEYKIRLADNRRQQKEMIKNNTAVSGNTNWTVNGSAAQGKKMIKDLQKLILRAFNSECDELIDKVKYNNFDSCLKRINASCEAISKLGRVHGITISNRYRELKVLKN